MPRFVSFVILVAIIVVVGALFLRVMAQFLVPLFLAAVLVVMFRPLHAWFTAKLNGRERIAAGLTTVTVLLILLLPLTFFLLRGVSEGIDLLKQYEEEDKKEQLVTYLDGKIEEAAKNSPLIGKLHLEAGPLVEMAESKMLEILPTAAQRSVRFLVSVLVGVAIMTISLYYFLADGSTMVRTVMRLSPLDDRHEERLLEEFDRVCRAVVVATLLSALVQGILAGIGFAVAGLVGVFFLSVLTMLLAMIPFVGAAAVWIPCSLWLYFVEERLFAAAMLALYGGAIVSMIDNLIKPLVLHGQSNVHPLLALLSILGGVQVLGPIGILVGPMVVAFLQALLNMLRSEIQMMEAGRSIS